MPYAHAQDLNPLRGANTQTAWTIYDNFDLLPLETILAMRSSVVAHSENGTCELVTR